MTSEKTVKERVLEEFRTYQLSEPISKTKLNREHFINSNENRIGMIIDLTEKLVREELIKNRTEGVCAKCGRKDEFSEDLICGDCLEKYYYAKLIGEIEKIGVWWSGGSEESTVLEIELEDWENLKKKEREC